MKYYDLVKQFVAESFGVTENAKELNHFERTVYWFKQFKPELDEAEKIAAYAHDIERAFRDKNNHLFDKSNYTDDYFLKYHPARGAEIVAEFLSKHEAPEELINRVKYLIAAHEIGGDDDQNLLKDADSVSYFENQIPHFINMARADRSRVEKIRTKFQWMFDRITSKQARDLARPMYEQAISELEKI